MTSLCKFCVLSVFLYISTAIDISLCDVKGKIIESSKNEKEFTKTASELLANADQNVEPQSDDEKRTLNRRTTKQSIADLYLELAKAHVSA